MSKRSGAPGDRGDDEQERSSLIRPGGLVDKDALRRAVHGRTR